MVFIELYTFEEIKQQLDKPIVIENERSKKIRYVLPGETITNDMNFMRGHGTYHENFVESSNFSNDVDEAGQNSKVTVDKQLISSLAGVVEPINRLISVRPLRTRYNGAVGDVVVGRIIDVQQKRWKVETNARLMSVLQLSSVNLPGGELRRRTNEDELLMRDYLAEGDLICAEVQTIFDDGALGLYTRSLKYGKLGQGLVIKVSPSMIAKRKIHTHNLPCGVFLIFGNNGWIFLTNSSNSTGGFVIDKTQVSREHRECISRVRNCILALSNNKIMLDYTSVVAAYEISEKLDINLFDLLKPNQSRLVAEQTRIHLLQSDLISI